MAVRLKTPRLKADKRLSSVNGELAHNLLIIQLIYVTFFVKKFELESLCYQIVKYT